MNDKESFNKSSTFQQGIRPRRKDFLKNPSSRTLNKVRDSSPQQVGTTRNRAVGYSGKVLDKVTSDISFLYELSLAVGQSLDLKTNCDRFLKTLMARKNLGCASVWIKGEYWVDLQERKLLEDSNENSAFLVYANPEFRIREKILPPHHPIFSMLKGKGAFSIASSERGFSEMITEKGLDKGAFAIFALGNLGILKLFSMIRETPFREEEMNQLNDVVSKFTVSLEGCIAHQKAIWEIAERKRAEEALRKSEAAAKRLAQENATIAETGRIISSSLNINEVYERFTEEVSKLIPSDSIVINIVNPEDNTITTAYVSGLDIPGRRPGEVIPLAGTITGEVIRKRSSLLFQTESIDEVAGRFPRFLPSFQSGIRSIILVPLFSKDQVIGALTIRSKKPKAYSDLDVKLTESIAAQIAGAIANVQLFTERKQAEEALKKSEAKFQKLFDEAPFGYIEINNEGHITQVNRTQLNMFGYTTEEMLGQPIWKFAADEEISRQTVTAKLLGSMQPGRGFERTYIRKDGTTIPVLIEDAFIRDVEGRIISIHSTFQDITERKRVEKEMSELQEQFRQSQKMEAIGRLAGGIAHDFNNLLTIIKGYSQLALSELKEDDPLKENVEEVQKAADRAANLTRQILAFSRRQILDMKVLDLNTTLQDLDKMLRRVIGEDIELFTFMAENLGRVKTDQGQIEQVIMNLAVNARDAMPKGGKLTVETCNVELDEAYARKHVAVTPGRYVMLSLSDTGCGMPPEVRDRIFEPFFTTKEKGKGTGLGLSTVYGIVKQSGGNIWVYSEPGKGSTFKIYLPCVDEALEEIKEKVASDEISRGGETILIVEDDEMVRKLALRILERQGYKILEACNGDEALLLCDEKKELPDLVLTDILMPRMGGHELAERLKSLHPEMKVLYMSGYTDNAIVHHGVLGKGINYIQKPFTMKVLAHKVREVLDR